VVRRVRRRRYDSVIIAGGMDYGLSPTYLKAALLARLCKGARRHQWEIGDELPGRPLWRAMLSRPPVRRSRVPAVLRRRFWRARYGAEPERGPTAIQIGITKGCNYHCLFCPFHSRAAEGGHRDTDLPRMSYQTMARLLGDLRRMGTGMVDICGDGEPLMHPEALPMISLARAMGFDVTLATNAALLTEQLARYLVDLGVRRMHVSFNAARDETYARLHLGAPPGIRHTIVERLRGMAEYAEIEGRRPIDVEFSAVLNRINMHEIPSMVQAAHEARAKWFMLILMGPAAGTEELMPRPEDWILIQHDIERAAQRARSLGILTNLDAVTPGATSAGTRSVYEESPYHIGHEYALVLADGSVMFCCQCSRPVGSLSEDSFERIWYSEAYRQARRQARELPTSRRHLPACECFTACSHVAVNMAVYRRLHGERRLRSVL
jgi:MoaA/NifB/PqqE/SkfB family radical SAM enzyme